MRLFELEQFVQCRIKKENQSLNEDKRKNLALIKEYEIQMKLNLRSNLFIKAEKFQGKL